MRQPTQLDLRFLYAIRLAGHDQKVSLNESRDYRRNRGVEI